MTNINQDIILSFAQTLANQTNTKRVNIIRAIANNPNMIGIFRTFSNQNTKVFLEYNQYTNTFKELFPEHIRELDTRHLIQDNQYFKAPKLFPICFKLQNTLFHISLP